MSAFSFNGFGLVTLTEGCGTPNGGNYSLRLEFPSSNFGYEPGATSVVFGWGFEGGYDRASGRYSPPEEEIRGIFRENFDKGVDWSNLIFILEANGFQESHKEGTFVRRR